MNYIRTMMVVNVFITIFIINIYDNIKLRQRIKWLESEFYPGDRHNFSPDVLKSSHNETADGSSESEESISSYEEERLAREKLFDERINTLKAELDYVNPLKGYEAQILDPMVYNLPHDKPMPETYDEDEVSN